MKGWLLDTNVVSELRKPSCNASVKAWSEAQPVESLYLSVVTIAEIRFGIEQHPDFAFRRTLSTWLDHTLRPWFADRLLEIDEDVVVEWRRMVASGKKEGITFSQPDLFIAATAKVYDLTVVTRNVTDFERASVDVINPWNWIG